MSLSNTIVDREVDWDAAVAAAEGLGRITLVRVAERNADAVRDWCLQMARAHIGEANALRGLSYLELAVLTGHHPEEVASLAGRGWDELVNAAEENLAAVRKLANEAVEARKAIDAEAKAKAAAQAKVKALEAEVKALGEAKADDGKPDEEPDEAIRFVPVNALEDEEAGA